VKQQARAAGEGGASAAAETTRPAVNARVYLAVDAAGPRRPLR